MNTVFLSIAHCKSYWQVTRMEKAKSELWTSNPQLVEQIVKFTANEKQDFGFSQVRSIPQTLD